MAVTSVLTLAVVLAASGLKLDFAWFIILATVPLLAGNFGLAIHLCRALGWGRRSWPLPAWPEMNALLKAGLPFTLPQLGALAITSAPPLIISAVLGPALVTPWHLATRLLALFSVGQQIVLNQLWPAYTEANARGDHGWLRRTYRHSIALSALAVALPQAAFFIWGPLAILWWSHGHVEITFMLALVFGLHAAVGTMTQPPAYLLNSLNRVRGQSIYGVLTVVISLAAMPWALGRFGLVAAPGAIAVVMLGLLMPCIYREAGSCLKAPANP
jgi:O-antigen/teichoic acid export membrane protein